MSDDGTKDAKLVAEMIRHEHQRWNHWAIGFFGAIGGVFALCETMNGEYLFAHAVAAMISLAWIGAAVGIRRSTKAWWSVAAKVESADGPTPFRAFAAEMTDHDHWKDFTECIDPRKCAKNNSYWFSVSKHLVRAGLLSFLAFSGLCCWRAAELIGGLSRAMELRLWLGAHIVCPAVAFALGLVLGWSGTRWVCRSQD